MTSKDQIQTDLEALSGGDFSEQAKQLLATLGYSSERTIPYSGDPSEFLADPSDTISRKNLLKQATSLKLVFQLTDEEISGIGNLFDNNEVDENRAESFYFVTAELQPGTYSRTKYAEMTREINKRYERSPAVILFRVDTLLTIAFIGRRPHQRDQARDVLGKVTLIKDIRLNNPHRAHLDILSELSLEECAGWIENKNKQKNFDGLLSAWLAKLDTEELNKRFYMQLFKWFERAEKKCRFPGRENKVFLSPQEHIIRLITRLMFIWFIKEKGLIAPALFNEEKIRTLLKDYDPDNGASYYRAVLQNLFFATLNTEIGKRGFSKQTNTTHRDFSLYRYKAEMKDPDKLLELFAQTPFINGGLFDCLDSLEGQKKGYRIDCFSDNPKHFGKLSIPNHLFFGEGGLIPLFEHYKFTVEENTPIEQEVALDPELLGKVFENLLAAYNPETSKTARKQTGSYYTPRAVVDYMVDEALIACLAEKVQPNDGDREYLNARLRYLLDYADAFNDADELFVDVERGSIVRAIMEMKILDPAVGSGAFLMGTLHKLTLALRRLNPRKLWEELQKEKAKQRASEAFETADQHRRDEKLKEISDIFQRYKDSDFGCKLYLIQNNLFGVDIQPVACQITKLRFFISLAIEQDIQAKDHNYGIKPLPNLETRFVAANTLLGLGAGERTLTSDKAQHLERKLYANREQYFHATNRRRKRGCQDRDAKLRNELAKELQEIGMPADDADKIAYWDPYDQNAKADWFNPEWMFGVTDGFDMVIGNPPYVRQEAIKHIKPRLKSAYPGFYAGTADLFTYFYKRGIDLLSGGGHLCYISSNKFMRTGYGKNTRKLLCQDATPRLIIDFAGLPVFDAGVDPAIILVENSLPEGSANARAAVIKNVDEIREIEEAVATRGFPMLVSNLSPDGWTLENPKTIALLNKLRNAGTPLGKYVRGIYYGVKTGYNDAFVIDSETRERLIAEDAKSEELIKPWLRGKDIKKWRHEWAGLYVIFARQGLDIDNYPAIKAYLAGFRVNLEPKNTSNQKRGRKPGSYKWYEIQDNIAYYSEFAKPKIMYADIAKSPRAIYDTTGMVCGNTAYIIPTKDVSILGIFHSPLFDWYARQKFTSLGDPWKGGGIRFFSQYMEKFPIPKMQSGDKSAIDSRARKIIAAKRTNPNADVSQLEGEIDAIVYRLYGLTAAEIATVEKQNPQA